MQRSLSRPKPSSGGPARTRSPGGCAWRSWTSQVSCVPAPATQPPLSSAAGAGLRRDPVSACCVPGPARAPSPGRHTSAETPHASGARPNTTFPTEALPRRPLGPLSHWRLQHFTPVSSTLQHTVSSLSLRVSHLRSRGQHNLSETLPRVGGAVAGARSARSRAQQGRVAGAGSSPVTSSSSSRLCMYNEHLCWTKQRSSHRVGHPEEDVLQVGGPERPGRSWLRTAARGCSDRDPGVTGRLAPPLRYHGPPHPASTLRRAGQLRLRPLTAKARCPPEPHGRSACGPRAKASGGFTVLRLLSELGCTGEGAATDQTSSRGLALVLRSQRGAPRSQAHPVELTGTIVTARGRADRAG